ncbi:hypothetical protein TCON_2449 [Astathelohania contejeani]|uniref:Uncharacterized protein n=1 Tax=Astathelohania contejeani TaxID=164912 RepID=A0ABQ7HVZ2_9MICR|nr:hypothetical protein TCON_2449 [Thelohania contejeani]
MESIYYAIAINFLHIGCIIINRIIKTTNNSLTITLPVIISFASCLANITMLKSKPTFITNHFIYGMFYGLLDYLIFHFTLSFMQNNSLALLFCLLPIIEIILIIGNIRLPLTYIIRHFMLSLVIALVIMIEEFETRGDLSYGTILIEPEGHSFKYIILLLFSIWTRLYMGMKLTKDEERYQIDMISKTSLFLYGIGIVLFYASTGYLKEELFVIQNNILLYILSIFLFSISYIILTNLHEMTKTKRKILGGTSFLFILLYIIGGRNVFAKNIIEVELTLLYAFLLPTPFLLFWIVER